MCAQWRLRIHAHRAALRELVRSLGRARTTSPGRARLHRVAHAPRGCTIRSRHRGGFGCAHASIVPLGGDDDAEADRDRGARVPVAVALIAAEAHDVAREEIEAGLRRDELDAAALAREVLARARGVRRADEHAPTDELDAVLSRRFDALVAAAADNPAYVGVLQENVALRDAALLRLEVDLALESPSAFQRERLALQVAGLRSTFRTPGAGDQQSTRTRIARLCALPAVPDAIATQRITRVIGALYAAG